MEWDDKLLFKKVCIDMGIPWNDNLRETEIDGVPATEYFKNNDIFVENMNNC